MIGFNIEIFISKCSSEWKRKTKKFIWTFSSYDTKDEVFSDRNIMPMGCVLKMTKLGL